MSRKTCSRSRFRKEAGDSLRSTPATHFSSRNAISHKHWVNRIVAIFLLVVVSGCSETTHSSPVPDRKAESRAVTTTGETQQTWDALYISGSKAGYASTTTRPAEIQGVDVVRVEQFQEITVVRAGQPSTMRFHLVSVENESGELREFESRIEMGPTPTITRGKVENGRLHITNSVAGRVEKSSIALPHATGGFNAIEQSLIREPMKIGEQRTITALMPVMNAVASIQLSAVALEPAQLLDGTQELLKIESVTAVGASKLPATYWLSKSGEPLKTLMPVMNMETFRTTEAVAKSESAGPAFDLLENSIVKVDRAIERPFQTTQAQYRLRLNSGNPAEFFASSAAQQVKATANGTAEVIVQAVRPDVPQTVPREEPPADAARTPNNLIQSDDPVVADMAKELAPSAADSWDVAVAAEKLVYDTIEEKGFGQALASAADVAKTREGDCTEHAVFLAALLRAREIPARVATGLVYSAAHGGFAYHMWTEAWIKDRWIPLDATLGRGGIGATHLKMSDSTLSAETAFDLSLQVAQIIGQLSIEVVEVN